MASSAQHSYGTGLYYGETSSPTQPNELGEVTGVTGPSVSVSAVDVTHLKSDDAFREFLAGLGDGGEVTFTLNYVPAVSAVLYALLRLKKKFRVSFPDGSYWLATAFITSFGTASEEDTEITQDVTLKVSGKPVFAAS